MGLTHQNLVWKSVVKWENSIRVIKFFLKKKKTKGTNTISIDTAEFKEKWSTKLWTKKENEDKKQFVIKRYKSNKLVVLKLPGERTLR